jgi:hypothetical protein
MRQGLTPRLFTCACLLIPFALSFTTIQQRTTTRLLSLHSTTEPKIDPTTVSDMANFPNYSEEQLKKALDGLLKGSSDPAFDGRHLFGYSEGLQDPNHKLSKLQTVTAHRILDYEPYLVSSQNVIS